MRPQSAELPRGSLPGSLMDGTPSRKDALVISRTAGEPHVSCSARLLLLLMGVCPHSTALPGGATVAEDCVLLDERLLLVAEPVGHQVNVPVHNGRRGLCRGDGLA